VPVRHAAALLLLAAPAALAAPPPPPTGPLPDWPCPAPQAGPLTPESVLGTKLPAPLPAAGAWQHDAPARTVADFASAPENPPQSGIARITAFGAGAGADRQAAMLLVLQGVVERSNALRDILIQGIGDKVVRSRLLAEHLRAIDGSIAALPVNASATAKGDLATAKYWAGRSLGDNEDEAALLCHRLGYLERKTRRLGTAIAAALHGG